MESFESKKISQKKFNEYASHIKNPYKHSTLLKKITLQKENQLPLRIAFLDIDSTMTGESTDVVREKLESQGYGIVFVTARTEEMMMTEDAYLKSVKRGFLRPPARIGFHQGKRIYVPAETRQPAGLLNPDIIAGSSGTQILIKQADGSYLPDTAYEKTFKQSPDTWRKNTLHLLESIDPEEKYAHLDQIEDVENYNLGITDIYPPKFRIKLICPDEKSKKIFLKKFHYLRKNLLIPGEKYKQLRFIRLTDDSNPATQEHVLLVSPQLGNKTKAVESIVHALSRLLKVQRNELQILIAGDSFSDIEMGLWGGKGTNATFIIPGGSRLSSAMTSDDISHFASDELSAIRKQLAHTPKIGHYRFFIQKNTHRSVIVGDKAFEGKKEVDTLHGYLFIIQ